MASGPAMSPQNSAVVQQKMLIYQARTRAGANWFVIIAVLSVINSFISMGGGRMQFIFGLGVTRYADALARGGATENQTVALVLSVLFAAFIALFGFFGRKEQLWAFYIGMALYVCDGLLLLPAGLYLDAAFHIWGLFRIFQGLQALNALIKLRGQQTATAGAVSTSWNQ